MNTSLFKMYMIKNHETQLSMAQFLGLPQSAISARINGKTDFRQSEIKMIKKRWNLTDQETVDIFFNDEVSAEDTDKVGA